MGSLSFSCSVFSGVNTARSAVVPLGTFVPLNIRRSCMPPPRGGVQAGSVVCGDHPKNQMPWPPGRAPQEVENQLASAELSKLPALRAVEVITYAEIHA